MTNVRCSSCTTDVTANTAVLTVSIQLLRRTLTKAMVEATAACKDLDDGNTRAAVGTLISVGPAVNDARALLDTIFIINRSLT